MQGDPQDMYEELIIDGERLNKRAPFAVYPSFPRN